MQSGNTWGQLQALPPNLPSHSLCEVILPLDLDVSWVKLVVPAPPKLLGKAIPSPRLGEQAPTGG